MQLTILSVLLVLLKNGGYVVSIITTAFSYGSSNIVASRNILTKRRWHTRSSLAALAAAGQDSSNFPIESNSLPDIQRIFILSDLHTDHIRNMEWLQQRCSCAPTSNTTTTPGPKDALIIAGDISHDLSILQETIQLIQSSLQCSIFFVPGNHEAWVDGNNNYNHTTQNREDVDFSSFSKLEAVLQLCQEMGVYTTSCFVGTNQKSPAWIVPIHRYGTNFFSTVLSYL